MKVLITCKTCVHGQPIGCDAGWCSNHEKYESIIPMIDPVKRRSRTKTGKYIMTDEFIGEREMWI